MSNTYKQTTSQYKEVQNTVINTPQDTYYSQYEYGQIKEQLQPGIEVSGGAGGTFKVGSGTFSAVGNTSITGIGFKPKYIQIQATITATNIGDSNGMADGTSQSCIYQYITAGPTIVNATTSTYCIYVYNQSAGNTSIGQLVSLDSDGFTINIISVLAGAIKYQYTAFG